ncbi:MAG: hypothetical protein OEZ34_06860, partial [Spirochaetia bacterium]|nr:hypothetical protein [Spirochaetia bacterium]
MLRLLKHLFTTGFQTRRLFSKKTLQNITEAVKGSEKKHRGEIRVCIESSLSPSMIFRGFTGKDRAVDMFSFLRVW